MGILDIFRPKDNSNCKRLYRADASEINIGGISANIPGLAKVDIRPIRIDKKVMRKINDKLLEFDAIQYATCLDINSIQDPQEKEKLRIRSINARLKMWELVNEVSDEIPKAPPPISEYYTIMVMFNNENNEIEHLTIKEFSLSDASDVGRMLKGFPNMLKTIYEIKCSDSFKAVYLNGKEWLSANETLQQYPFQDKSVIVLVEESVVNAMGNDPAFIAGAVRTILKNTGKIQ